MSRRQYQKLPPTPTVETLYLLDPLIATGGTAVAAISILVSRRTFAPVHNPTGELILSSVCRCAQLDWGLEISQIKVLSILGSKPGLTRVAEAYPGLEIYTCGIDDVVRSVLAFLLFARLWLTFRNRSTLAALGRRHDCARTWRLG